VGRVTRDEGIDCDFVKSGSLTLATAPAHLVRVQADIDEDREWGFGPDDYRFLDAAATRQRIRVRDAVAAAYTPHCAALHPARLARGLARTVEAMGVRIYEGSPATDIEPGVVSTERGRVRADVVVRATEGYTPLLPGARRAVIPVYSLMIVTEPLPSSFWHEVGWQGRETMSDGRHLIIYAQRTADDRIAFGGRGAPYHFGSRIRDEYDREPKVFRELHRTLVSLFPGAADARITHEWGGCLGIPRDWYSSVGFDPRTRIGWAGGYVGDGVSTTNLAGRTIADLVCGRDTDITRLPWVNHRSRTWEPEPFRWLGVNLSLKVMASADRVEARTGRPARRAKIVQKLTGF
jgi:glycine/D-amino acid oxidase-like deaminating enzyme